MIFCGYSHLCALLRSLIIIFFMQNYKYFNNIFENIVEERTANGHHHFFFFFGYRLYRLAIEFNATKIVFDIILLAHCCSCSTFARLPKRHTRERRKMKMKRIRKIKTQSHIEKNYCFQFVANVFSIL